MANDVYKGYPLFNELEDVALRNRNRGVILANIAEDHTTKERKISLKGTALLMGYFQSIPEDQRKDCTKSFADNMNARGFAIVV